MAVERIETIKREAYEFEGYERVEAVVRFAVDPSRDTAIADLDRAERGPDGLVRFESDLRMLVPRAPTRMLFMVANRGRLGMVPFSHPTKAPALEPTETIEPGDGFLLRRGWAVVWCGWQWDVVRRPGLVGLEAPQALRDDGGPIAGPVRVRFQPSESHDLQLLSHWPLDPGSERQTLSHRPYPAASDDGVLTVRDRPDAEPRIVPRGEWGFADATHIGGRFEAGKIYELAYTTSICPVAGTGLLAVRDVVAHLRYDELGVERAYGYGVSQTGRFLRQFLHDGMNADERGRVVFDGVIPHVAGARRGEFNFRYAQPSVQHARSAAHEPPFDTGELARRAGAPVKVVETNSSSEYWRSDASLVHTEHPDVRQYLFAGTMHGAGMPVALTAYPLFAGVRTMNWLTTVNYTPLLRAALTNLDAWVSQGVEPPPSAVPQEGVPREDVLKRFADVASVLDHEQLPTIGYDARVSDVDDDLNEIDGIRLPDLTVPLAAHTGWNPRHPSMGGEGQGVDMLGSTVPFDPETIARRYAGRDDYLARVRAAAEELVARRYLLAGDVEHVVVMASRMWDLVAVE